MKKVAIISCAMALPGENGYTRFSFLADFLAKGGYQVDVFTSSFHHWEKKQRNKEDIQKISKETSYGIYIAREPGYQKNVDLKRVISHLILTKQMIELLHKKNIKKSYDLFYCVIPDNFLAARVSRYGRRHGIPVIIDIEDTWPEGMEMVFHVPIISKLVFYPFRFAAKTAYQNADAFVGTSDEYRDVPLKYKVNPKLTRKTVYVGSIIENFDKGAEKYCKEIKKKQDEFWVTYAGTLGASYDIATLIKAAQQIYKKKFTKIKFLILGDGPLRLQFEHMAMERECSVSFMGYMPYEKMAAYLVLSDVLVNSFVKNAPQSIVNKISDYLAAGRPMINTCSSKEFQGKVMRDGFGINVPAESPKLLMESILSLYHTPDQCVEMGRNARRIAVSEFDRKNSYGEIASIIDDTIFECNHKK